MIVIRLGAVIALAAAAVSAPASAAGGAACVISSTPLAFGKYVPTRNRHADFTATVTVTCAAIGPGSASVEGTIGLLGASQGRALRAGAHRLRYQLFADPARTIVWGDGSGEGRARAVSGLVGPAAPLRARFTIYGRILAGNRSAGVGNYADQITVVLNY